MKVPVRLSRREFLKTSGSSAAGSASLMACSTRAGRDAPPEAARHLSTPGDRLLELDAFNCVVGTQTSAAKYGFTGKPRLLETAQALRDMGASVIGLRQDRTPPARV